MVYVIIHSLMEIIISNDIKVNFKKEKKDDIKKKQKGKSREAVWQLAEVVWVVGVWALLLLAYK